MAITSSIGIQYVSHQPTFRRFIIRVLSAYAANWETHFHTLDQAEPMNPLVPRVRPSIW